MLSKELGYGEGAIGVVSNKLVVVGFDEEALNYAVGKLRAVLGNCRQDDGNIRVGDDINSSVAANKVLPKVPIYVGKSPAVTDMGDECYKLVFDGGKEASFREYLTTLSRNGYRLYAENKIDGNEYYTYTNNETVITAMYTKYNTKGVFLAETLETTSLPPRASDNRYTPVSGLSSSITQIGLYYDNIRNGNVIVPAEKNYFNGMSYVVKLDDGSFIVVDGGHGNPINSDHLYEVMKKQSPSPDNIVIAAWFFSHGHDDHISFFPDFAVKYSTKVTVERFVHNFPNKIISTDHSSLLGSIKSYFKNSETVKAHPGQVFYLRNAKITMLYTIDVYESDPYASDFDSNNTSIVWKMELEGKSFMCLGDYSENSVTLMKLYTATTLKSDIVQVAHHGISGQNGTVYTKIKPEYAFWPVGAYHVYWDDPVKGFIDLHLDKLGFNSYFMNMDQKKVFIAGNDITVMTINDGKISTSVYDNDMAYFRS